MRRASFWIVWLACAPAFGRGAPTPEESLAALRLADPKLEIRLVAKEPDVAGPVAVAWDEAGRLYVVEMTDYPNADTGGRIKRLEDRDGDGFYEHAVVFADGLRFPTGVLPWRGGVLVTAAPDLLHFKDEDGDGAADVKRVILTGFGEGNQQLRVNGPTWGLDNWVYLANGRSGGSIRRPGDPPAKAVPIPRDDLRLRPDTGEFEPVAGFSQFGLPRDDRGDRFPSWNTVPLRHVVIENRLLARNPALGDARAVADVLDLSDGGRVYSLAPAQTRFNAESVAYFNATCGSTIVRGGLLGDAYRGHALICEPLSSLVHHRRLVPDGPTYRAERVEAGREFLASTNPWFRPVNLATGPDGALYVVDFCRALVEHPDFVPKPRRGEVDFREGRDRGRIWRIALKDAPNRREPWFDDRLSPNVLIAALSSADGWRRDTAQRLLVERRDPASIPPLGVAAARGATPLGRVHALWTLEGLAALDADTLRPALSDPDAGVREQAAKLAEPRAAEFVDELVRLTDDADPRVRFRAALALAPSRTERARTALARLAARDADSPWIATAVLSGLDRSVGSFFNVYLSIEEDDGSKEQARAAFLVRLAAFAAATEPDAALGERAKTVRSDAFRFALIVGAARANKPTRPDPSIRDRAAAAVDDPRRAGWLRALGLDALAALDRRAALDRIAGLLEPGVPAELRAGAASLLGRAGDAVAADRILERWERLGLEGRRSAVAALATAPKPAERLIAAVEASRIAPAELDPAACEALRATRDAALRRRVDAALAARAIAPRADVIRRYEHVGEANGDPARGRVLFDKNCATCHALPGKGAKVGPDLASVAGKPAADLLVAILDPNREVAPDGVGVVVATVDGRTLTGLLAEESAAAIRLKRAEGIEDVVPRSEVETVRSTGRSLMPEGFETALGVRDVADLLAFLRSPPSP